MIKRVKSSPESLEIWIVCAWLSRPKRPRHFLLSWYGRLKFLCRYSVGASSMFSWSAYCWLKKPTFYCILKQRKLNKMTGRGVIINISTCHTSYYNCFNLLIWQQFINNTSVPFIVPCVTSLKFVILYNIMCKQLLTVVSSPESLFFLFVKVKKK